MEERGVAAPCGKGSMENPRPEKVAVVEEVQGKLADSEAAIITEYRGMTVAQMSALRRQLRDSGGEYCVYKNTLVRIYSVERLKRRQEMSRAILEKRVLP